MKKCDYCGKDYPDEADTCAVDGNPLTACLSVPPMQAEAAGIQRISAVVRAAIVSGAIFLLGAARILVIASGPALLMMLASVLLACLVAIAVVALLSRRSPKLWSWLRVIIVTLVSYIGVGLLFLALAFGLSFVARSLHQ